MSLKEFTKRVKTFPLRGSNFESNMENNAGTTFVLYGKKYPLQ